MPEKIEAWQCDFCDRKYTTKSNAKRHEKVCIFNPEVKACITCEHSYYKWPGSKPGCREGLIKRGGNWTMHCPNHKYQGYVGID